MGVAAPVVEEWGQVKGEAEDWEAVELGVADLAAAGKGAVGG